MIEVESKNFSIEKINLCLTYLDNTSKILKGNQYEKFLESHIIPTKIELNRQLSLLYARETTN